MTAPLPPEAMTTDRRVDIGVDGEFDAFFMDRHPVIVRALALALGDDELGRDAAAEGFTRALQRWRRVSRYDNPSGWVYRVGLNWARSRRRKALREISMASMPAAAVATAPPAEPDPRLTAALRELSLDHRAVIVCRYYLDWSEAQTADALGIKRGTVKSRLSRALDQLARALGDGSPR